jgi:hypothetical protein
MPYHRVWVDRLLYCHHVVNVERAIAMEQAL